MWRYDTKYEYMFMLSLKNLSRKGLINLQICAGVFVLIFKIHDLFQIGNLLKVIHCRHDAEVMFLRLPVDLYKCKFL